MYLFPKSSHNLLSAIVYRNSDLSRLHNNTDPAIAITGEVYDEDDRPYFEYYEIEIKDYPLFLSYVNNSHLSLKGKTRLLSLLFLSEDI